MTDKPCLAYGCQTPPEFEVTSYVGLERLACYRHINVAVVKLMDLDKSGAIGVSRIKERNQHAGTSTKTQ